MGHRVVGPQFEGSSKRLGGFVVAAQGLERQTEVVEDRGIVQAKLDRQRGSIPRPARSWPSAR